MQLVLGCHPSLPFAFTNGPTEPTPPPLRGLPVPPRLATQQLHQGYQQFAALITYWLRRAHLSGAQLPMIAAWALGEQGWLDSSKVSRIRNSRLTRGCSLQNLMAFGAANEAIWLWQTRGKEACWERHGPHTIWGIKDIWMDGAAWLHVPDQPTLPLEFADFAEVLVGLLDLPYLGAAEVPPDDIGALSSKLRDLLAEPLASHAPNDRARVLLDAYPSRDANRQSRLIGLVLAGGILTRGELESELFALAEVLRTLRGLPEGSYGPSELTRELAG